MYPFNSTERGIPVFGRPIQILPASLKGRSVHPQSIWKASDSSIQALAVDKTELHFLVLENKKYFKIWKTITFKPIFEQTEDIYFQEVSFGEVAAVIEHLDGFLTLYSIFQAGNSTRSLNLFQYHQRWREADYHPFSGSGIYNGIMPYYGILTLDVYPNDTVSSFRQITPRNFTGGLLGLTLGTFQKKPNETVLIAGSRNGQIFHFFEGGWSQPRAAIDITTNYLFVSKTIGPSVMGYPALHGADDLIIGGENGLHYISVNISAANKLGLSHRGPILESGAVLVTGQTPTVSIADWDGDGYDDIIAGSSEGRMFIARQSDTNIGMFHRPVPINTGSDNCEEEILVQGGYMYQ